MVEEEKWLDETIIYSLSPLNFRWKRRIEREEKKIELFVERESTIIRTSFYFFYFLSISKTLFLAIFYISIEVKSIFRDWLIPTLEVLEG